MDFSVTAAATPTFGSMVQLNEQANRLARGLRSYGVGAGDTVILAGDKQVSLYVGVWGILKAGASYVPVDVAYPGDRIRFIEEDAVPKAVLTNVSFSIAPPDCPVLSISETVAQEDNGENLPIINTKDDIAYIIYTSGTTGNPKGVNIIFTKRNIKKIFFNVFTYDKVFF